MLKIHCHWVQMTCVLSVKEMCACTQTLRVVSESRSISLTLLLVMDSVMGKRQANWALLSHSDASLMKWPWPLSLFVIQPASGIASLCVC